MPRIRDTAPWTLRFIHEHLTERNVDWECVLTCWCDWTIHHTDPSHFPCVKATTPTTKTHICLTERHLLLLLLLLCVWNIKQLLHSEMSKPTGLLFPLSLCVSLSLPPTHSLVSQLWKSSHTDSWCHHLPSHMSQLWTPTCEEQLTPDSDYYSST